MDRNAEEIYVNGFSKAADGTSCGQNKVFNKIYLVL